MSRRIDVELTSARDDGSWTWRAAGARQPKGVLDGSVLYEGAKVGDVVRAEAEFELEGIVITTVFPPRAKEAEAERLEVIGPPREPRPAVTTTFVPRTERPRRGDRGAPGDERRRPERPRGERPARGRTDDAAARSGRRPDQATRRPERRPARPGDEAAAGGTPTDRRARPPRPPAEPTRPAPKRLTPGNTHRNRELEALSPEQRPIAEQLLRGGLPAVRQAIATENEKAKAEGRPAINPDQLVAMAEDLLPRLKTAAWRDRAEAAAAIVDEIGLRDLRSVVASADASARDDETRMLASTLRQALERRLDEQGKSWIQEIGSNLDEGRVVRALRMSARPPDPSIRFPADLALRLAESAAAAMSSETPSERWLTLLDAVAASPVRRNVKPAGLPDSPNEDFLNTARLASGRVPAVATLLGLPMPPPPGPAHGPARHPGRPPRPPRPPRPAPRRPEESSRRPGPPAAADGTEAPVPEPAATRETSTQVEPTSGQVPVMPVVEPAAEVAVAPAVETAEPVAEQPVVEAPVPEQPPLEQPEQTEEPVAEHPVPQQPVAEQPVPQQPEQTEQPVAEQPAVELAAEPADHE
ncbi:MAG TPA: hypothetical protein VFA11_17675 [Acidimicrobiales bacterium]|nr:hypothetical protein [Acidimicrobiales bacterium]